MKGTLNKYYFIASIFVHILVAFGISYMIHRDAMANKNVVVLGAHSRYSTKALYKRGQSVPFVQGKGKSGKGFGKPGKKNGKKRKSAIKRGRQVQPLVKKSKASAAKKNKVASKSNVQPVRKQVLRRQAVEHDMPQPTAMLAEKIASKPATKKLKKQKLKRMQPIAMPDIEEEIVLPVVSQPEPEIEPEQPQVKEEPIVANDAAEQIPAPAQPDAVHVDDNDEEEAGEEGDYFHVGQPDAVDLVARYHQRVLSHEITRLWTPPVGVRKGTECVASITFDPSGTVKSLEFVKRSSIPIYDLSVLRLKLVKFDFPPDFRFNKPLIIVFHQ
jgi:hypothetical protein